MDARRLGRKMAIVLRLLRLPISKHQDVERRGRLSVSGLFFCSIDPPWNGDGDYEALPADGLELDGREGAAKGAALPPIPDGVFIHCLHVQNWNWRSIHIAARDARFEWIGEPQPSGRGDRAFFPGDEVPDP